MSLMKSDRTKAPKSDRIAGYAITPPLTLDDSKSPTDPPKGGCWTLDDLKSPRTPPREQQSHPKSFENVSYFARNRFFRPNLH